MMLSLTSSSFAMAELERKGGVSPRTSPLAMVSLGDENSEFC